MFHSNTKGKPTETCWQIYYSEINVLKKAFLSGVLNLKLKDGKKLQFTGFSGLDKKTMPQIFNDALETFREMDFAPPCSQSREHVCGRCFEIVPKGNYKCKCGTEFWKPSELALRSLVIPSWGDFLMKHTIFAFVELLGFFFSLFIIIGLLSEGEWILAIIIVGFVHGLDAIVTYFIAQKGLHPKGKNVVPKAEISTA